MLLRNSIEVQRAVSLSFPYVASTPGTDGACAVRTRNVLGSLYSVIDESPLYGTKMIDARDSSVCCVEDETVIAGMNLESRLPVKVAQR